MLLTTVNQTPVSLTTELIHVSNRKVLYRLCKKYLLLDNKVDNNTSKAVHIPPCTPSVVLELLYSMQF